MNRNKKGQFTSMKLVKRGFYLSLIVGVWMVFGHPVFIQWYQTKFASNDVYLAEASTIEPVIIKDTAKIEEAKWSVIDELEACEGGDHTWDEGFIKLDSNDLRSYGRLQFQRGTVQHYAKLLWGTELTGYEAVMVALTKDRARQLAYDIIYTSDAGVDSDWVNCSKWHQLQAKVDILKSLDE